MSANPLTTGGTGLRLTRPSFVPTAGGLGVASWSKGWTPGGGGSGDRRRRPPGSRWPAATVPCSLQAATLGRIVDAHRVGEPDSSVNLFAEVCRRSWTGCPYRSAREGCGDRVAARGLAAHRHRGRRKAAGGRPAVGRGRAYRPTSHDAASRRRLTDAGGPGLIGPGPPVCPAAAGALADPAGTPADDQELGRLPWLALLFLRAFFLRAFFAMLCLLVLVTIRPRASAARSRTGPTALRGPTR